MFLPVSKKMKKTLSMSLAQFLDEFDKIAKCTEWKLKGRGPYRKLLRMVQDDLQTLCPVQYMALQKTGEVPGYIEACADILGLDDETLEAIVYAADSSDKSATRTSMLKAAGLEK